MYLASAPDVQVSGGYFEGTRLRPVPAKLADRSLQDRVWTFWRGGVRRDRMAGNG